MGDALIPGVALFTDCAAPGCAGLVSEPGGLCPACLAELGAYVRRLPGPQPRLAAAGDDVPATPAKEASPAPPSEWRMNQRCWVCEERRKCRQDPSSRNGWICTDCLAIPAGHAPPEAGP